MGAWSQQNALDRLVSNYMDTDPLYITLKRPVWSNTAAGGRTRTGTDTVAAQRFYIQPFKRRLTIEFRYNPQTYGEEKVEDIHYILTFERDQDIQQNDEFDPSTDIVGGTDRLLSGLYIVTFISARLWDRGQAGIRYRG